MTSRAEQTKTAILRAAIEEFARYGIAGARVDRITRAAEVNNALLFRYFGNKAQLFDAAFETLASASVDTVPFDAADLPGYAGRLFDQYETDPELVRLAAWYQLERSDDELPAAVVASHAAKLRQLEDAQRAGLVSSRIPAEQLLSLVVHLSLSGSGQTPVLEPRPADRDAQRAAIVEAVRAVTAP
ncbi:TetR family transcriptional regulator [Actinoplanes sp. NPDC048796]|uniref:TetR/AcrR family transcriptional regulator n=1 Tax=unclassified Actinoplanes TaxID=2626549 RepID=UPI0033CFAE60